MAALVMRRASARDVLVLGVVTTCLTAADVFVLVLAVGVVSFCPTLRDAVARARVAARVAIARALAARPRSSPSMTAH